MPEDMMVGHFMIVDGPRGGTYTIRRPTFSVYTCDCQTYKKASWLIPETRTCQHIVELRGLEAELERIMGADAAPLNREKLILLTKGLPTRLQILMRQRCPDKLLNDATKPKKTPQTYWDKLIESPFD